MLGNFWGKNKFWGKENLSGAHAELLAGILGFPHDSPYHNENDPYTIADTIRKEAVRCFSMYAMPMAFIYHYISTMGRKERDAITGARNPFSSR